MSSLKIRLERKRNLFLHVEREAVGDKLLSFYEQAYEIVINLYNSLLKGVLLISYFIIQILNCSFTHCVSLLPSDISVVQ